MHPGRCAAQREVAQRAIRQHVETLADRFGLDDTSIPMAVNWKQPEVAAMEMELATERVLGALVAATAPAAAPPKPEERPVPPRKGH